MKRIKSNPRGLTITDVARKTNMSRQAIHYNVKMGYLPAEKDDSGIYRINRVDYWNWRYDFYVEDDIEDAVE